MIQLHRKLEAAANACGNLVDGWRPLRLESKGWVVAGKNIGGEYRIEECYPAGELEKSARILGD